uniref:Probable enoyl-CoA hydratase, mitochondrial n=1 Tax=Phallusia mammillata TaxID=59560 RepID=A0A6F9DBQ4_9ASCI|nr:probable enoyl-CoA hydratase, mitochondrial [Phallusia mammillata]
MDLIMYRTLFSRLLSGSKTRIVGHASISFPKHYLTKSVRYISMDYESVRTLTAEPAVDPVTIDKREKITLIGLNRPNSRNAVNRDMARQLTVAFKAFENDEQSNVAVLHGIGEHFCAGYDLKELATSKEILSEETKKHMSIHGAMGPTHLHICKPVIAAVNGYAVAGGLELALLCDLRVFEQSTQVGVLSRRFGVPLIDGGTVRLPALIGMSKALDLILTGRLLRASEAQEMGIANRVTEDGGALSAAVQLAKDISNFPQLCLRADRNSTYHSVFDAASIRDSLEYELENAMDVLERESISGAQKFVEGVGRKGMFS